MWLHGKADWHAHWYQVFNMVASVSVRPRPWSKVNYKIMNDLCCSDLLYEPLKLQKKKRNVRFTQLKEWSVKEREKRWAKLCFCDLFLMKTNIHIQFCSWMIEKFKLNFSYLFLMAWNWVLDKMEGLAYVDMLLGASWALKFSCCQVI